ncbi:hypothetical protein AMS68_005808 [Peltaster fructicola]|uniref:Nucleoporin POM152 n=1 Tax=Peltaster fructicola TaxID=286661 RepID=A0A6H0Y047_9PEZI|nr:hypothetical protein AMS68_005808 [Peltaster fructicola]
MSATPRMRSSYPQTPRTQARPQYGNSTPTPVPSALNKTKSALATISSSPPNDPVIPESWIEAPHQRLYAAGVYALLWALHIVDYVTLQESEEQGLWMFMKWMLIDGAFLFGLPSLRIPWLEWSSGTMLSLFLLHVFINGMLMFQVSMPISMIFTVLGRSIWGAYELAVNENSVSVQSLLHNDSLILGRQIIHILPEGSAILNADRQAFCLDAATTEIRLPLTINSTNPISMEILRIDLETQANETLHFNKGQLRTMHKEAERMVSYSPQFNEPKTLYVPIKRPGLYSLARVIDETNLEVSKKYTAQTVIVPCPKVSIASPETDKCRGELSNVNLEVTGTPPLRVKYHRFVNQASLESVLESIQPEDFFSPLQKQDQQALVMPNRVDTEWAKSRIVQVPMSEHLSTAGTWAYTIDEVTDGFGNVVTYTSNDQDRQERHRKALQLHSVIKVHERPVASLEGSVPLKIALGKTAELPTRLTSTGRAAIAESPYQLEYIFSPTSELSPSGDHGSNPQRKSVTMEPDSSKPQIKDAGLYSLVQVSTDFCSGDVIEPASILLENPPTPDLVITSQEIFDKCAGRPVGLRVDLDLTGTPPFTVMYSVSLAGDRTHDLVKEKVTGHRGQLLLTPSHAGHYVYKFYEMHDAIYQRHNLRDKELVLEQDVKPSAGAKFAASKERVVSCIDDIVSLDISLKGEGPFNLEYELLHGGKRKRFDIKDVSGSFHSFSTPPLNDGGEYTVALKSITDGTGCKEFLNDEVKINVRHQKPKAAFGRIDGEPHVDMLEGKKAQLPLRLVGEGPWKIRYRDADGKHHSHRADHANDRITAASEGTYTLLEVDDALCPGLIDEQSKTFDVKWVPRPEMRIATSDTMERKGNVLVQQPVCEGEEDAIELLFKGAAPFSVQYTEHIKPLHGVKSPLNRELKGLQSMATLRLDTSQAGTYDYKFTKLEDANYEHNNKHFSAISIQQQVFARPSAAFVTPGKTYSFCSVQSDGEEVIPVNLHGHPPFDLELEVRHQGAGKPEIISLNSIQSNHASIRIPHKSLHLGKSFVALRRVKDSRGCSRILDSTVPRVQIAVFEPPTIFTMAGQSDICVGEYIEFGLGGTAPFTVFYKFEGHERKAVVQGSSFRRLAEKPGTFAITGIQDSASGCRASVDLQKVIHGLPSARVSRGRESYVDIHEGGTVEILFEFGGAPPFEFTYQRSANVEKGRKAGAVLDTRSEVSDEHSMRIRASEEGTYEVVSIKDRYCAYSKAGGIQRKGEQKRLTY